MLEIEKRYKIKGNIPFDLVKFKIYISQTYSAFNPDVRIRYIKNEEGQEQFFHTVKYKVKNNERIEIEQEISKIQYDMIFDSINKKPVRKNRYIVPIQDNLIAEIDEFLDSGDIIVEVEFPNEDKMKAFEKPDWFGEEIKEKESYSKYVFSKINKKVGEKVNSLISDKMETTLENIMGMFFQANRLLDRCSSVLSVKFVMPNTTKIVHKKWSHLMPLIADKISDYCDDRNYAVKYPITTADNTDYESLTDMFNRILNYMVEIEDSIIEAVEIAKDENDIMTKHFLEEFLYEEVRPYTKLAQNFVDYIEKNGDEPEKHMSMDARIEKFLGFSTETD